MSGVLARAWAAATVLALGASGCMGPSGPDDLPTAARTAAAPADGELQIVTFGPHGLSAGEDFYLQANGEVAMWVEVNRPLDGLDASIWLAGERLQRTVVKGRVVTGMLPASLALPVGVHRLQVRLVSSLPDAAVTADADFRVEPGHARKAAR